MKLHSKLLKSNYSTLHSHIILKYYVIIPIKCKERDLPNKLIQIFLPYNSYVERHQLKIM